MKNELKIFSDHDINQILDAKAKTSYLAMYSSQWGGITRDTKWMMVPIDDHVVHRGDGVFEAIKFLNHQVYGLDEHLQRLSQSSRSIELASHLSIEEIKDIILQTVRASGSKDGLIRLYLTRGTGGFTTNPYDCSQAGLYIVITQFTPPAADKYSEGVSCKISKYAAKEDFYTQIKSCNYLQNVLMKKDAVDSKVDFTLAVDARGFITEGSTENCAFVNDQNELLIPSFENTLRGITITRVIELAEGLVTDGELKGIREKHISQEEAFMAEEMAFIGTSLDVLPATTLNEKKIGTGKTGPIFKKLQSLLIQDIQNPQSKMNTPTTPKTSKVLLR